MTLEAAPEIRLLLARDRARIRALEQDAADADAHQKEALDLVKAAFQEGWQEGVRDDDAVDCPTAWAQSQVKACHDRLLTFWQENRARLKAQAQEGTR